MHGRFSIIGGMCPGCSQVYAYMYAGEQSMSCSESTDMKPRLDNRSSTNTAKVVVIVITTIYIASSEAALHVLSRVNVNADTGL